MDLKITKMEELLMFPKTYISSAIRRLDVY